MHGWMCPLSWEPQNSPPCLLHSDRMANMTPPLPMSLTLKEQLSESSVQHPPPGRFSSLLLVPHTIQVVLTHSHTHIFSHTLTFTLTHMYTLPLLCFYPQATTNVTLSSSHAHACIQVTLMILTCEDTHGLSHNPPTCSPTHTQIISYGHPTH